MLKMIYALGAQITLLPISYYFCSVFLSSSIENGFDSFSIGILGTIIALVGLCYSASGSHTHDKPRAEGFRMVGNLYFRATIFLAATLFQVFFINSSLDGIFESYSRLVFMASSFIAVFSAIIAMWNMHFATWYLIELLNEDVI